MFEESTEPDGIFSSRFLERVNEGSARTFEVVDEALFAKESAERRQVLCYFPLQISRGTPAARSCAMPMLR